MTRRPNSSIVANPILVGTSTLLVVLVAVFLAYNANTGLPFVPTYEVTAYVRDADELGRNADVRIGGKRVGAVSRIEAVPTTDGKPLAALSLKLDETAGPLPADTQLRVRPRSVIGLKYLQLTPGDDKRTIPTGGKIPLANARGNVDLQDALNAFDTETRRSFAQVTSELGSGLAGRGPDLNLAIQSFDPLTDHLGPVMRNLADPATDLGGMLKGLESAAAATAPVAPQLGGLFDGAATTLHAVARVSDSFGSVIDQAPATERAAVSALRVAQPVLDDATTLVDDLKPSAKLLPAAATGLAGAVEAGTPVLDRAAPLADRLSDTLAALRGLVKDPSTSGSVVELTRALDALVPTLAFLNPIQTRCNYLGLYMRNASSTIGEGDENGNWFRFMPLLATPDNPYKGNIGGDLHFDPYVDWGQDGRCVAGNEKYAVGTQVGPPVNAASAPTTNPQTKPPAGTGGAR